MQVSITQATMELRENDLPNMVLLEEDLVSPFDGFSAVREGELDNRTMAEHGFSGATEQSLPGRGSESQGMSESSCRPQRSWIWTERT